MIEHRSCPRPEMACNDIIPTSLNTPLGSLQNRRPSPVRFFAISVTFFAILVILSSLCFIILLIINISYLELSSSPVCFFTISVTFFVISVNLNYLYKL